MIDRALDIYAGTTSRSSTDSYRVLHGIVRRAMIDNWHKYCQRQMRDNYHTLDDSIDIW